MVEVKDFAPPLYQSLGEAVGGTIELVRPRGLARPFVMIVNDEGLLLELPLNRLGSILYETHKHGSPIVGNIVIMKEGMTSRGPDIIGLKPQEEKAMLSEYLIIGQVVKPQGIRGEVKVRPITSDIGRFEGLESVYTLNGKGEYV